MKRIQRGIMVLGLLSILVPRITFAQQYFRELGSPQLTSPVVPLQPEEEEKYNLMLGPVRFSSAVGLGLEWNDNINLADHNPESDFILRPSLNIDAAWRITEMNTLRLSLGASYAKYFSHPENDTSGLLISPNTQLAFTMHIGAVVLTFRDAFNYQEDPFTIFPNGNSFQQNDGQPATFRRFTNLFGIQADWQPTELITLSGGYNFYYLWPTSSEFESQQCAINTVYLRPSMQVSPAVTVGLNASASLIHYKENIQNNGTSFQLGPFANIKLSEATQLYVEAGYQSFRSSDNGSISDTSNGSSWYGRLTLSNRLTESFSHRLSFTKTLENGFLTNFYDLYHVDYGADWRMTPSLTFIPTAFYEHYTTSGSPNDTADETANRVGVAAGLRYVLTPSITAGLDYRFVIKNSNLPNDDYRQNLVLLTLYYNF